MSQGAGTRPINLKNKSACGHQPVLRRAGATRSARAAAAETLPAPLPAHVALALALAPPATYPRR
eukprot:3874321-Prymnesium_polylepis.1